MTKIKYFLLSFLLLFPFFVSAVDVFTTSYLKEKYRQTYATCGVKAVPGSDTVHDLGPVDSYGQCSGSYPDGLAADAYLPGCNPIAGETWGPWEGQLFHEKSGATYRPEEIHQGSTAYCGVGVIKCGEGFNFNGVTMTGDYCKAPYIKDGFFSKDGQYVDEYCIDYQAPTFLGKYITDGTKMVQSCCTSLAHHETHTFPIIGDVANVLSQWNLPLAGNLAAGVNSASPVDLVNKASYDECCKAPDQCYEFGFNVINASFALINPPSTGAAILMTMANSILNSATGEIGKYKNQVCRSAEQSQNDQTAASYIDDAATITKLVNTSGVTDVLANITFYLRILPTYNKCGGGSAKNNSPKTGLLATTLASSDTVSGFSFTPEAAAGGKSCSFKVVKGGVDTNQRVYVANNYVFLDSPTLSLNSSKLFNNQPGYSTSMLERARQMVSPAIYTPNKTSWYWNGIKFVQVDDPLTALNLNVIYAGVSATSPDFFNCNVNDIPNVGHSNLFKTFLATAPSLSMCPVINYGDANNDNLNNWTDVQCYLNLLGDKSSPACNPDKKLMAFNDNSGTVITVNDLMRELHVMSDPNQLIYYSSVKKYLAESPYNTNLQSCLFGRNPKNNTSLFSPALPDVVYKAVCGNKLIEAGESYETCPADVPAPVVNPTLTLIPSSGLTLSRGGVQVSATTTQSLANNSAISLTATIPASTYSSRASSVSKKITWTGVDQTICPPKTVDCKITSGTVSCLALTSTCNFTLTKNTTIQPKLVQMVGIQIPDTPAVTNFTAPTFDYGAGQPSHRLWLTFNATGSVSSITKVPGYDKCFSFTASTDTASAACPLNQPIKPGTKCGIYLQASSDRCVVAVKYLTGTNTTNTRYFEQIFYNSTPTTTGKDTIKDRGTRAPSPDDFIPVVLTSPVPTPTPIPAPAPATSPTPVVNYALSLIRPTTGSLAFYSSLKLVAADITTSLPAGTKVDLKVKRSPTTQSGSSRATGYKLRVNWAGTSCPESITDCSVSPAAITCPAIETTCLFDLTKDTRVAPSFTATPEYPIDTTPKTLTLSVNNQSTGYIIGSKDMAANPVEFNCGQVEEIGNAKIWPGTACSQTYPHGTIITLVASVPGNLSDGKSLTRGTFSGWGSNCTSMTTWTDITGKSYQACQIKLEANKTISASFTGPTSWLLRPFIQLGNIWNSLWSR